MPYGQVMATATVTGAARIVGVHGDYETSVRWRHTGELDAVHGSLNDPQVGKWVWSFANPELVLPPENARGRPGLWEWPA